MLHLGAILYIPGYSHREPSIHGSFFGAICSVINLAHLREPFGHIAPQGAMNGSPTWARLITEQWLLLWSQTGSFSSICVVCRLLEEVLAACDTKMSGATVIYNM